MNNHHLLDQKKKKKQVLNLLYTIYIGKSKSLLPFKRIMFDNFSRLTGLFKNQYFHFSPLQRYTRVSCEWFHRQSSVLPVRVSCPPLLIPHSVYTVIGDRQSPTQACCFWFWTVTRGYTRVEHVDTRLYLLRISEASFLQRSPPIESNC